MAESAVDDWAHDGQGIMEYFYVGPQWFREEAPLDAERILDDFLDFMLFIHEFDSPFLRKCILHTSLKLRHNVLLTERERYMHRLHSILKEDCIANPDKNTMVVVKEFYPTRKPPCIEPDFPGSSILPYLRK